MADITKKEWPCGNHYKGFADDLIRAGIIRADQVPGIGSNPKTCVTFKQGMLESSYIRRYMRPKSRKPAIEYIAGFPLSWCRRDESNTRPSHYE